VSDGGGIGKGPDESVIGRGNAGGVKFCNVTEALGRETDPEIEAEGLGEMLPPIKAEGLAGDATDDFVPEIAAGAWMIAVAIAGSPEGDLFLKGADDALVVEDIGGIIDGRKAGAMSKGIGEGDGFFSPESEPGPDGGDGGIEGDAGIPEGLEEAGGGRAFGAGIDEGHGAGVPGLGMGTVAEAAGEADDLLAVAPDGDGGSELAAGGEVLLEDGSEGGLEVGHGRGIGAEAE